MKKWFFIVLALSFSVAFTQEVFAANRTWTNGNGNNNWSDAGNWSGGKPGAGDVAVFDGATTSGGCTIDELISVAGISIESDYAGTITQGADITVTVGASHFSQAGGTFSGSNGTIQINGNAYFTGGTFNASTGETHFGYNLKVNTEAAFNHNNGTVFFDSSTDTCLLCDGSTQTSVTLKNVTLNKSNGRYTVIESSKTLIVDGTLTYSDGYFIRNGSATVIKPRGNVVVNSTDVASDSCHLTFDGSGDQTFSPNATTFGSDQTITVNKPNGTLFLGGNLTSNTYWLLQNGTLNLNGNTLPIASIRNFTQSGGTFVSDASTLTFNGPVYLNGGTFNLSTGESYFRSNLKVNTGVTFNHNNGTAFFDGSTDTCLLCDGSTQTSITLKNVTLNKSNSRYTVIESSKTLIVDGTLTYSDGYFIRNGSATVIKPRGNVVVNSTDVTSDTCHLTFDGSGDQTFTPNGTTFGSDQTITISKPTGTLSVNGSLTTNAYIAFTGGTIAIGNNALSANRNFVQSDGTFTSGSGSVLIGDSFSLSGGQFNAPSTNLTVNNNFTKTSAAGTFNSGNGTVILRGANHNIDVNALQAFYNLTLYPANNTGRNIGQDDVLVVQNDLNFTDGGGYQCLSGSNCRIEVYGNVTLGSDFDGGWPGNLWFRGSNVQTFNLNANTDKFDGNLVINKDGGQVNLLTALTMNYGGQDLTVTAGIFNIDTNSLAVNDVLTLNAAGTLLNGGSNTISAATWQQNGSTFNGQNSTMSVGPGSFTLAGGTFTSTSGTLTLHSNGTFTHIAAGSVFNHNNGTVVSSPNNGDKRYNFDATAAPSSGQFYNFIINADSTWQTNMQDSDVMVINNDLTLTNGTLYVAAGSPKAQVYGDVTVASTWDGGNLPLEFVGTNDQDFSLSGASDKFDGSITVNKPSGTVTPNAAVTLNLGGQDFTITSGQLTLGTNSLTVADVLTLNAAGTLLNGGSNTITAGTWQQNGSTFNGQNSTMSVGPGSFTLAGGTFTSTSGTLTLTGSGIFTHIAAGSAFNHNNGTVVSTPSGGDKRFNFDATTAPSSGQFYNFTINAVDTWQTNMQDSDVMVINNDLTLTNGTLYVAAGSPKAQVYGDVTVVSTWDGGNLPLEFVGTNDQDFFLSGGSDKFDGNITLNKPSGAVTPNAAVTLNAGGQDFTITSGQFTLGANSLTVADVLTLNAAGTLLNGGSNTISAGTWQQNGGTFNGQNATMSVGPGSFTLAGGTFTSTSGTLTLHSSGMFTHTAAGSVFNHNNGTIVSSPNNGDKRYNFDATAAPSSGQFYNFIINADSTWQTNMQDSDVMVINNDLTLTNGTLYVAAGSPKAQVYGDVTVASTWDGGNLPLEFVGTNDQDFFLSGGSDKFDGNITLNKPSGAVTPNAAVTLNAGGQDFTITSGQFTLGTNSLAVNDVLTLNAAGTLLNGGSNTITAETWQQNGGTFNGQNSTINLGQGGFALAGGTFTATSGNLSNVGGFTHTAAGSVFNHNNGTIIPTPSNGDRVYNFDATAAPSSGQFYNLTINSGGWQMQLRDTDTLVVNNDLTLTNGTLYINSGTPKVQLKGNLRVESGWDDNLVPLEIVGTGTQNLNLDGGIDKFNADLTINKASGQANLVSAMTLNVDNQDLTVTSGTFDLNGNDLTVNAAGGRTFTVSSGGNLQLQGGEAINGIAPTLNGGSTVTYDGIAGPYTIKDYTYSNLAFAGAQSSIFTLPATKVLNNLTITSGIFSLNGNGLTIGSLFNNTGTLRLQGGETFAGSMDTDSGTAEYVGSGSYASLKLGTAYNNLTFNGSGTWTLDNPLTVNGNFGITQGTLDANAKAIAVKGNWANTGTFTANANTVTLSGTNQALSGATTFYNLTKANSVPATLTLPTGQTTTVNGLMLVYGKNSNSVMSLVSSSTGSPASLNPAGNRAFQYLSVQDINNTHATIANCHLGCTNVSGNTNWSFSRAMTNQQETTWEFTDETPENVFQFAPATLEVNNDGTGVAQLKAPYTGLLPNELVGWTKKQVVTISNAGSALTDYQIKITVPYDGDMQPDFDDIRFTTSDNNTLNYWLESKTDSASAVFWVKVPSVPTGSPTINMYYGSGGASSASNGANTFLFFDDFSGPTLKAGWTEITAGGASAGGFADGKWTKNCDGECDWWSSTNIDAGTYITDPGGTWEAITKMTAATASASRHEGIMLHQADTDGYMWGLYQGADYRTELTGSGSQCSIANTTVPSVLKVRKKTDVGVGGNNSFNFWLSTNEGINWTQCGAVEPTDQMTHVGLFIKDWTSGATSASFDYFFLKKYATTEPTTSLGAEQTITPESAVAISQKPAGTHPAYSQLYFLEDTLSGDTTGETKYQVSPNGTTWYYLNGNQEWVTATADQRQFTELPLVNAFLTNFVSAAGTGDLYFKAHLISDGSQPVAIDKVRLTYKPPNVSPVSLAGTDFTVNDFMTISLAGTCTDTDATDTITATWSQTAGTSCGALAGTPDSSTSPAVATGSCTAPDVAANEPLTFRLTCNDGQGGTAIDDTVVTVNAAPVANAGPDRNIAEEAGNTTIDGSASADPNAEGIAYAWTEVADAANACTPSALNIAQPVVTVLNKLANYSCTYSLVVNDGRQNSASDTVVINVSANNDAPVLDAGTHAPGITEGTNKAFGTLATPPSASDVEGQSLTYSWILTDNAAGKCTLSNANALMATLNTTESLANYNCTAQLTVSDSTNQPTDTVTFLINADNDVPTATAQNVIVKNNTAKAITLTGADPENSALTYAIVDQPSNGALSNLNANTGQVTYTPNSEFKGTDAFTFRVNDGAQNSANATVNMAVTGVFIVESGGSTLVTEGDPTPDTYTIKLATQPTETVNVSINAGEQVDTDQATLTFTAENWNTIQTVTITAADDDIAEAAHTGPVLHTVTSADTNYNGISVPTVSVLLTDDDSSGISIIESAGATVITEAGATDTYTIVLTSEPTDTVTISLASNAQVSTNPVSVVFDSGTWSTPQTITVTAIDDAVAEGAHPGTITHTVTSVDANYNAYAIANVTASITDNDAAALTMTNQTVGTVVSTSGVTNTLSFVLTSRPTAAVTITPTSGEDLTFTPASLTFETGFWNQPQTIAVSLDQEADVTGTSATILATAMSVDLSYNTLTATPVVISLLDDYVPPIDDSEDNDNGVSGLNTANAGPDKTVVEGRTVTLNGQATPSNEEYTYLWQQISGTTVALTGANTDTATFTAPAYPGTEQLLTFRLFVSDDNQTLSDDVTISIRPQNLSSGNTETSTLTGTVSAIAANGSFITTETQNFDGENHYRTILPNKNYLYSDYAVQVEIIGSRTYVGYPYYFNGRGLIVSIGPAVKNKVLDLDNDILEGIDDLYSVMGGYTEGYLGSYLSSGDFDGNDTPELWAYAVSGHGSIYVLDSVDLELLYFIHGEAAAQVAGNFVGLDFDNNGTDDIIAGVLPGNVALDDLTPAYSFSESLTKAIAKTTQATSFNLISWSENAPDSMSLTEDAALYFDTNAVADLVGTGDVNGDGVSDFVTVSTASCTTMVYLGSAGYADQNAVELATTIECLDTADIVSLAIGDVNNDGIADILMGYPEAQGGNGVIYIVYGTSSVANITAANAVSLIGEDNQGIGGYIVLGTDENGRSVLITNGDAVASTSRVYYLSDDKPTSGSGASNLGPGGFGCGLNPATRTPDPETRPWITTSFWWGLLVILALIAGGKRVSRIAYRKKPYSPTQTHQHTNT